MAHLLVACEAQPGGVRPAEDDSLRCGAVVAHASHSYSLLGDATRCDVSFPRFVDNVWVTSGGGNVFAERCRRNCAGALSATFSHFWAFSFVELMVLVLVTNHSALMHPHPFANDAVWGAHSGNIGKSARLPAFSRKNSAWHRQTHCVCLCLGHQFVGALRIFSRCRSNNPRILGFPGSVYGLEGFPGSYLSRQLCHTYPFI